MVHGKDGNSVIPALDLFPSFGCSLPCAFSPEAGAASYGAYFVSHSVLVTVGPVLFLHRVLCRGMVFTFCVPAGLPVLLSSVIGR